MKIATTENKIIDISIIIVNWNTRDILYNCLNSVFQETKGIIYEVIVIDNASIDNSVDMIREKFPQVILIENQENKGFAAANNQGIAISKGRYILLLNSDTVILNNAISKTVSFADANPETAVVSCRVLNSNKQIQSSCFQFPSLLNLFLSGIYLYKLFPKNKFFGRELLTWWDKNNVNEVDVVVGCYLQARYDAILQIGLLDEQFFMYSEETDWCYRFKQAGWKVLFTPDAEIIHYGGESSKKIAVKMLLEMTRSRLCYFKKHKGYIEYILASILIASFYLVRIPYWLSLAVCTSKEKRKVYLQKAYSYLINSLYAITGGTHRYWVRSEK